MSGQIYSNTSFANMNDLLNKQEEDFKKIDKEKDNNNIVRYAILVGVSALVILSLKLLIKKNKK